MTAAFPNGYILFMLAFGLWFIVDVIIAIKTARTILDEHERVKNKPPFIAPENDEESCSV
jgi:hypothetical protein